MKNTGKKNKKDVPIDSLTPPTDGDLVNWTRRTLALLTYWLAIDPSNTDLRNSLKSIASAGLAIKQLSSNDEVDAKIAEVRSVVEEMERAQTHGIRKTGSNICNIC